jgi:glutamyl-tRNA synthetase
MVSERLSAMPPTKTVVTRFAPSPTGYLHIGGARTALFNWLFARHHGGTFLLRIEDTDRERSTPAATDAIFAGLRWLGLDWDGEAVSQFTRAPRHREVAEAMVARGTAYRCYATKDEVDAFREAERAAGRPPLYRSPWRDADPATAPDAPYVIRLRAPRDGSTTIEDAVQGTVTWKNETLDDLILVRSDGVPTYMHAVVVDDHDMAVTHIIRGDDHLTNAARQTQIYRAMDWDVPVFAHIPLIHGEDGKKLSKRHGALGVEEYRAMGYPAVAMRNYLARLGWSHGDDEFFSTAQAVEWFSDLGQIGRAPARLDFRKLDHVSGQHIRAMDDAVLARELEGFIASQQKPALTPARSAALTEALPGLKERVRTYVELLEMANYILGHRPFVATPDAAQHLDAPSRGMLADLTSRLRNVSWDKHSIEAEVRIYADSVPIKLGRIAQPIRVALTGRTVSPSVFDVMITIGRDETLLRLADAAAGTTLPPADAMP